jgi:asparagine N-glycosylation enzyme membrane subunit Stt3
LTVLRDPYTLAAYGQVRLVYAFRAVYEILQAGAIGYGLHA